MFKKVGLELFLINCRNCSEAGSENPKENFASVSFFNNRMKISRVISDSFQLVIILGSSADPKTRVVGLLNCAVNS